MWLGWRSRFWPAGIERRVSPCSGSGRPAIRKQYRPGASPAWNAARAVRVDAIFGRTYAAEPDVLIQQLKEDEAIAAADTLLLTVPSQLGVDYNAHVIDSILTHVAPALGWR
jgi:alkanesulfonate monooxygenase SsuD/methylene tetrahydromethanopterin reductase-like flavin-dependent oxidoreductase (luciferase family)